MNNDEIAEDVHHLDFTTATEWEIFIARIEEILHEWKLSQITFGPPLKEKDFINLRWLEVSEKLNFADVEFTFKHYKLKTELNESIGGCGEDVEDTFTQCQKDILNASNDFAQLNGNHLEIARFYGVREFLVLIPSKRTPILDETRIKILLSSLAIAASNSNCEVPVFVQVLELWQQFYLGVGLGRGSKVNFNMIHLKRTPPHCKHLNGLLTLFKQKISEGCGLRLDPAIISIRFSYIIKDWINSKLPQEFPDFEFLQGETIGVSEMGKLPFGASYDPIRELHLFTTWHQIAENIVVDSEGFSDLDPLLAPEWSLLVKSTHSPNCLLGDSLTKFFQICHDQRLLTDIIGDLAFFENEESSLSLAFNILTESRIPTISNVVGKRGPKFRRKNSEGPISENNLIPIMYFLFPDADENCIHPYEDLSNYNFDENKWKGIKSCAIGSLIWRLAIVAVYCLSSSGGIKAFSQLWFEFIQEIRFRWDKGSFIPGLTPGTPDCVHTCLLHQKLQMINHCIHLRKTREEAVSQAEFKDMETDSEEEDEFYECSNEEPVPGEQDETQQKNNKKEKHFLWNRPVGRSAKHPSFRLVKTGDPLYLPVTQDQVLKTEDQLEEDAQVMMELGTDKQGTEMRARLMSASLLSDMESFKAANPGAVLQDFIRWYSPRDWVEEDTLDEWGQPKGHLSQRMLLPDNAWTTTWSSAQPVPAHRQKRLFDDTREAEKALIYLNSRRIGQVAQLLLPVLTHAALVTLSEQKVEARPNIQNVVQNIQNKLQLASKPVNQKMHFYEDIIRELEVEEGLIEQVKSLQSKFAENCDKQEVTSFVMQLMRGKEVSVPNGSRGNIGTEIIKLFCEAQKVSHTASNAEEVDAAGDGKHRSFSEPSSKEFILRAVTPRPSPLSTPQPQRLYVCLEQNNIRLAGAFSEDTMFF
ncbi:rab3 GTPase-activating protein catalytic subunit [Leptopilina boulardi]|uniref:rab3 GTPase-activating protein catalytic subunit n=1 Tax=Leptopilina boulardi TaxID=63433 RepID=UPI0021F52134|nr:rab3 GTPase-activating protein catalytic subunit [Leptopilina boulardi]